LQAPLGARVDALRRFADEHMHVLRQR
jgi:hypothetical protein